MAPNDFAHADLAGCASMLIPSTTASACSNLRSSDSYPLIWLAQTGVNASGWNASTTFFDPRNDDSFTVPPRWLRSSKSGAS